MAKKKDGFNYDEYSYVMNNTVGMLQLYDESSNKKIPLMEGYGKKQRIKNSVINDMSNNQSELFQDVYALILNPELVEELGLTEIYKYVLFTESEIDELLMKSDIEIEDFYNNAPMGMKKVLSGLVRQKVEKGEKAVDSANKQRFFEDLFNVKFEDLFPELNENLKMRK